MIQNIKLDDHLLTLLERLDYETLSKSNTIATLLENSSSDVTILTSRIFQKYHDDYASKFTEYDFARQQVNKMLLGEFGEDGKNVSISWSADFGSGYLTVSTEEEKGFFKLIHITIKEEDLVKLQELFYTVEAMRAIIIKLMDRHKLDTNIDFMTAPAFKEYQSQMAKLERDLEHEKTRVSALYLPSGASAHKIKWGFDFMDNLFEVSIFCECGVELFEER